MRLASLVAAVALCAPLAVAGDAREVGADLRHAETQIFPHAVGNVGIREGSDFDRFTVTCREVGDGAPTLIVQLAQNDQFSDVGTMSPTSTGFMLNMTTQNGGTLPLGVAHAHELSGHAVRVTDGDHNPILVGFVPTFDATVPPQDPPPHDPPPTTPPAADIVGRAEMVRPENSPYDASLGVIVAVHRSDSEALRIEVGRFAPGTHYDVYIGDDNGGTRIGDFTANDHGGGLMVRDTAQQMELPLGLSLADLAGRHVEIRHEQDVVLFGAIPHVEDHADVTPVHQDARQHDDASGASVHIVVDIRPRSGRETCDFGMTHLPTHEDAPPSGDASNPVPQRRAVRRVVLAELWMDDGTGTMQLVGTAKINRRGQARLHFTTRRGGVLPLGVATLRELANRGIEVRVNGRARVAAHVPGA